MLKLSLNPYSVMIDFKLAAIRAFQNAFTTATITGCMFHFGQCVWRKLQAEGFLERYRNEPDFALLVKRLLALVFVLPQFITDLFEQLIEVPAYRDIEPICDYLEDNFIGRLRRNRRGPPRFPIQLWSQFFRVIDNLPCSNNAIEGWHNAFYNVVGFAHPTTKNLHGKYSRNSTACNFFVVNWKWEEELERTIKYTYASTRHCVLW